MLYNRVLLLPCVALSRPCLAASSRFRHPHDLTRPSAKCCQNMSFSLPQSQRHCAIITMRLLRLSLRIPTTTSRPKRRPTLSASVMAFPFRSCRAAPDAREGPSGASAGSGRHILPSRPQKRARRPLRADLARVLCRALRHATCGAPLQRVRGHPVERLVQPVVAPAVENPHEAHAVLLRQVCRNPRGR